MKLKHIKTHISYKLDREAKITWLRDKQPGEQLNSLKMAIEGIENGNGLSYYWLLFRGYEIYREMMSDELELFKETGSVDTWNTAMAHLQTSHQAIRACMQGMYNRAGSPLAVSIGEISCELQPEPHGISRVNWALFLFDTISLRKPDLLPVFDLYDAEKAAEKEPKFADRARFYVNYIKGMLRDDANHDRLFEQYTQVFATQFNERARVALKPLYYVAIGDEANFEKAMFEAGKTHQRVAKGMRVPMMATQSEYPADLIAAASLAYDKYGWTLKHKNDYVPEWWIYNRFTPDEQI